MGDVLSISNYHLIIWKNLVEGKMKTRKNVSLYRQLGRQAEPNSQFHLSCLSFAIWLSLYAQTISDVSNAYRGETLACRES